MPEDATVVLRLEPSDALTSLVNEAEALGVATGGGESGGGGRRNMAGKGMKLAKQGAGMVQAGLKKAGVSFGIAAILKQSQIFTGFFGSLFQIIGAMLDVMLAPLMPILMPFLVFMGKMIPVIAKIAQFLLGPIVAIVAIVMKVVYWILGAFAGILTGIIDGVNNYFGDIIDRFKSAWGYFKEGRYWMFLKEILIGLLMLYFSKFILAFYVIKELIAKAWDWLLQFKPIRDLRDWWNGVYSDYIKPVIAHFWNWIIDALQKILDAGTSALSDIKIMGKSITPTLTGPDLSGMRMDAKSFGGINTPIEVKIDINGTDPQEKVSVDVDEKRVAVNALGMQIGNLG
jgi:hypothetical protein